MHHQNNGLQSGMEPEPAIHGLPAPAPTVLQQRPLIILIEKNLQSTKLISCLLSTLLILCVLLPVIGLALFYWKGVALF